VSRKQPPPLPSSLWSPLGPVPVRIVERLRPMSKDAPDDVDDFGGFEPKTRVIEVLKDLEPWAQWQALRHEWVHMVIYDAGVHNAFTGDQIECLCDLIGTALAAEMRNQ
jgi:hypothetical protein